MLSSPAASLYCPEMVDGVEASWDDDALESTSSPPPLVWTDPACPIDDLMASEAEYCPDTDYLERLRDRPLDCAARQGAISWILKVHAFYGFQPATAYLAVNYLDRFLSCNQLPQGSSSQWPWQLLSVACLSVAAKMEETQVPLLLDLQVMDPQFVFDPNTVQRMELLLMAALRWRMRSVTPFDVLDRLDGAGDGFSGDGSAGVLSRATALAVNALRVVEFVSHKPSEIAAAAVVCAAGEASGFVHEDDAEVAAFSSLLDMVGREAVDGCRMLMEEYLLDTCPSRTLTKQSVPPVSENPAGAAPPRSPVGVLEAAACGSCSTDRSTADARTHILGSGSTESGRPSNEGPSPKRPRLVGDFRCTESIDDTTADCGADL